MRHLSFSHTLLLMSSAPSVDNWQTALRKQYMRRDPTANPIGPEPPAESRQPTRELSELPVGEIKDESQAVTPAVEAEQHTALPDEKDVPDGGSHDTNPEAETRGGSAQPPRDIKEEEAAEQPPPTETEESKDWLELPMLDKLDSMHLLTEWQFQNPHRLRQIMKSDDEYASWVSPPCHGDASG